MGSDESHFNVSVGSNGQSHKTVSSNHNLSEEKGEPKRYRTEVLPLTSLTPYRWAKPAHDLSCVWVLLLIGVSAGALYNTTRDHCVAGGPLFEGDIEDYNGSPHVMCPWHAYLFDLKTGKNDIGLEVSTR